MLSMKSNMCVCFKTHFYPYGVPLFSSYLFIEIKRNNVVPLVIFFESKIPSLYF